MAAAQQYSLWQFLFGQHIILQIIGVLMILSFGFGIYNFIKNYLYLSKNTQKDSDFIESIVDDLHEGKIESALDLCHRSEFAEARVVEKALIRMGRPIGDIVTAIKQQEDCEHIRLQQHMMWVGISAKAIFMLALLACGFAYNWLSFNEPNLANINHIVAGVFSLGLALALPLYLFENLLKSQFKKANLSIKIHLNYFCDAINKTR